MAGPKRPGQYAGGPMLGSLFVGMMGPMDGHHWEDGPKYRNTNTASSSRCVSDWLPSDSDGPWAASMQPSPLGRGLPSRFGFGKSF